MTEIKFRVWDGDQQCFVCPVGLNAGGKAFKWYKPRECVVFIEKPQQYTGLKDKNGTEIYEGDIVALYYAVRADGKLVGHYSDEPTIKKVKFNPCTFCDWSIKNNYNGHVVPIVEVIGNVYENPELL